MRMISLYCVFSGHHYYIHVRCSKADEARLYSTEKGRLFVRLTGTRAQTPVLEAKKEYVSFSTDLKIILYYGSKMHTVKILNSKLTHHREI